METNVPEDRLRLYRRAAGALNAFFGRWTGAFCGRCLEVTARAHPGEADAAMELVEGRFAGCCQAGVAETLSVPRRGGAVAFPAELAVCMAVERDALDEAPNPPRGYALRGRESGQVVEGVGCRHLGDSGCRLGELKAPLCLTYLCPAVRAALEDAAGPGCCGDGEENFCGSADALRAVVSGTMEEAGRQVGTLEARLGQLTRCLEDAEVRSGQGMLNRWLRRPRASGETKPGGEHHR